MYNVEKKNKEKTNRFDFDDRISSRQDVEKTIRNEEKRRAKQGSNF